MNRRAFLAAAAAAATFGGWMRTALPAPQPGLDQAIARSRCRPPTAAAATAAWPDGPLSYAGTRLLKDGFLWDLAAAYNVATARSMRILGGGCDDGVRSVREGKVHLGGLCCPPATNTPPDGLGWLAVADDLLVVLCHPGNPIEDIGLAQVRALARGELRDWRRLGGPDRPVAFAAFDHCPDYVEPLREILFGDVVRWSPAALMTKTDHSLLETVARFEGGVTIYNMVLALPLLESGALKAVALDGVAPLVGARPNPHYPLRARYGFVFERWHEATMRPFFDFLYGPAGQAILARRLLPLAAATAGYPEIVARAG